MSGAVRLAQGSFYLVTGIWPLFGIRSFQRVTGPKTDLWLVRTVGLLTAVVGSVLLLPGEDERRIHARALGAGTAAALGGIDLTYVANGTISGVYLLDAAAQLAFLVRWKSQRTK